MHSGVGHGPGWAATIAIKLTTTEIFTNAILAFFMANKKQIIMSSSMEHTPSQ